MDSKKETIIISLGGSLVAPARSGFATGDAGGPDKIDISFLKKFKEIILKNLKGKKFIIFVGGGKIARLYQNAAVYFGASDNERDWLGINVTRLNAEIIKNVFGKIIHQEIIIDPTKTINTDKNIMIGAGWKPGWSTDYVAVMVAKKVGAKTIINLTNIDYVCDKDPRKFKDAKPLKEISWKNFRKLVGSKWSPGYSSPFDPIASKLVQSLKLNVIIINGKHLERLNDFLNNKEFIGTKIHD